MRRILPFICIALISLSGNTQDFHLSQYNSAPINFNPAMTGMFKGNYRIHGHYRTQWQAVATRPFTTGLLSFDMPVPGVKNLAVGAQIANQNAGQGNYNVFAFLASAAYDFKLDKGNAHHLSVGIQGGFFQKSVDPDRLFFQQQYSPMSGGGFDAALPNGESFASQSVFQHDLNAGLMYYYAKPSARFNPFIGGAAFHITEPEETFFSLDNKIPMRFLVHGGSKINVNQKIQFVLKALYMQQRNASELTYSLLLHYYLESSDAYIIFGPTYRNKDAAIIEGGIRMNRWEARISYDINTSSLRTTSNGRGGFEIGVTYIMRKFNPNPIQSCPRL